MAFSGYSARKRGRWVMNAFGENGHSGMHTVALIVPSPPTPSFDLSCEIKAGVGRTGNETMHTVVNCISTCITAHAVALSLHAHWTQL